MLGWLWRVIVGRFSSCQHVWTVRDEGSYEREWASGAEQTGLWFVLQCSKCGDLKTKEQP